MAEKRKQTSRPSRSKTAVRTVSKTAGTKAAGRTAAVKKKAPKKLAAPTPIRRAAKKAAGVAGSSTAARAKAVSSSALKVVETALDDLKAVNVRVLDVRKLTDVADTMIIASGNSDRHVRSIADRVISDAKKAGYRPMGVEGERDGEWVLVDLQDVIVHIMLPRIREFYRLENLWDVSAARREAAERAAQG
jgi:ribosome-associated protein